MKPPGRAPGAVLPAPDPWFHPFAPYLIPLALALTARVEFARKLGFAAEDAYITFRYAQNWAAGLGPVYNPGEHVLGFSSPLWTAWLALGAFAHVPILAFSRVSGVAFDLAALVVIARVLDRDVGRAPTWAFAIFFALFPLFAANAVLGMETSLCVFLLAAAAAAIFARAPAAGPLLGLFALARPETFAVALVLAWFADGRARLVAGAIAAVGLVALTAYFGSPVPQSVTAKAMTYGVGQRLFALNWIEGLIPAFLQPRWQELFEGQHLFAISVVTLPALIAGLWALGKARGPAFAIALGGLLVLAGYMVLGVPYFGWYYVLPIASWAVAVAAGLPRVVRSPLVWAALAVYVVTDAPFLGTLYIGRNQTEAKLFGDAAGTLLQASGGRGTVFLEPIGHVGWVTGLRVIDEVGLVSPDVPRMRTRGPGWYADVVRTRRPDYLVVRPALIDQNRSLAGVAPFRSFAERNEVFADYEPLGPAPTSQDALLVLARRAAGAAPAPAPADSTARPAAPIRP